MRNPSSLSDMISLEQHSMTTERGVKVAHLTKIYLVEIPVTCRANCGECTEKQNTQHEGGDDASIQTWKRLVIPTYSVKSSGIPFTQGHVFSRKIVHEVCRNNPQGLCRHRLVLHLGSLTSSRPSEKSCRLGVHRLGLRHFSLRRRWNKCCSVKASKISM